uniref:DUF4440 domain-containing protein n=1 Tax=Haemonchus contortus TaxID=6289 RepID=A0A7I4YXY3_HAECO
MQPKDVQAILDPIYKKFEDSNRSGYLEEAAKIYHSQAVVVEKGKKATYGKEGIVQILKEFFEKIGQHKFLTTNVSYQGTNDYLMAECDFEVRAEKGGDPLKGKMNHIWKKEDGEWRIYHEEFEMK